MAKKSFNLNKNNIYTNRNAIKNNVNTIIPAAMYESKVNYTELNVTNEEKTQLINYEQIVVKKQEAISLSLMELSTALYNAQQILSQRSENGDGRFYSWFMQLGLSKSFVYRCLDKYKLYLISNMETVMDLTVKETAMITKALKNKDIEEAEIVEIIQADNITKYLDEKIYGPEEKMEVDMTSFLKSSKEEQVTEMQNLSRDIKIMNDDLKSKKEKLNKLKDEMNSLKEKVNDLKEKIILMKEIEKNMKMNFVK